jgi:hypothetical protein
VTRTLQKTKALIIKEKNKIINAKKVAKKAIKKKLIKIVQKKVQAKAHKTYKKYKATEKKLKELVGKGKVKLAKKYQKKLSAMKKRALKYRKKADVIIRGGKKLQRLGKKQEVDKPINPDDFKAKVVHGQTFFTVKVQMKVELKPGKPFK